MSVETQEKPQTIETDETFKIFDELFSKHLNFAVNTKKAKELIESMKKDLKSKEPLDPMIPILQRYADEKAQTQEMNELLLETIAYSIFVYMTSRVALDDIEGRMKAYKVMNDVNSKTHLMVKAKFGETETIQIFPKKLIEDEHLDSDEAIIEFAKKQSTHFDEVKDGEFKVLRNEDFDNEFNKTKDMAINHILQKKDTEDENE